MSPKRRARKEIVVVPGPEATQQRDYTMARVAAARASASSAVDALDEAMQFFIDPEDDDDGDEREELIETALENLGMASRALECAEGAMPKVDPTEGEPWDDSDEEE